jgi:hypothetical protein
MTIPELYDLLCDEAFQDPATGDLFFRAYMYIYKPEKEYYIREQIADIKKRLIRPNTFVNVLVINLFEEFKSYLESREFGKGNLLKELMEREASDCATVEQTLKREANNKNFFAWVNDKIQQHLRGVDSFKKSYVFVQGFGEIYPYLRASKFLSNFEKYISGSTYKIIMFYPGSAKNYYSMFNLLNDENPYRAIKLINPDDQDIETKN